MIKSKGLTIAIDGPAGAGKGTCARLLADRLGLAHIDSGAMYRAVALETKRCGLAFEDEGAITDLLPKIDLNFTHDGSHSHVMLNGEDVESFIRTPEISRGSSVVSQFPVVREKLAKIQRLLGEAGGIVMEGRDIGTSVLPGAGLKIFLTATTEERARRRVADLHSRGLEADYETTLVDLRMRDQRDTERSHSPLKKADDAIEILTDNLTIDEVVEKLVELAKMRN